MRREHGRRDDFCRQAADRLVTRNALVAVEDLNTQCGHTEHADVNVAKNILAVGQAVAACTDLAVRRSVKQEPLHSQGTAHQPTLRMVGIPWL